MKTAEAAFRSIDSNIGDNQLDDASQFVIQAKALTFTLQGKLGLEFPGQIFPLNGRESKQWAQEMMMEDFYKEGDL